MLSDVILQILNRGASLKSREIAQKASMLSNGDLISKEDIKREIFKNLKDKVTYDETTYQYYLTNYNRKIKPKLKLEIKEMIIKILGNTNIPLSAIDISNEIKKDFKCALKYEKIELIILTELKFEVGIVKDRLIKYYLY